jgi:hypothetical protein
MIKTADLRQGDQVLLLADTRSDKATMEALTAGLRFFGAERDPRHRTHRALRWCAAASLGGAMHASDVVIWVWPVFITIYAGASPWA